MGVNHAGEPRSKIVEICLRQTDMRSASDELPSQDYLGCQTSPGIAQGE
jgi:hypothetical protein